MGSVSGNPHDRVRLLLVDDHQVLRQALSEVLISKGRYQIVGEAADGSQLLALIAKTNPDIIIMDMAMPRANGASTIEELKREGVEAPILVLAADEGEKTVRTAMKAGAKGFVPKHVGLSELEFAIDAVLQGKTYLSPSVTEGLMSSGGIDKSNDSPLSVLSKREIEILTLLVNGKPNRDIGKMLHISTRTVDTHRSNILKKLKVKTNAELVKMSIQHGLVTV